jgi:hypothetical protein
MGEVGDRTQGFRRMAARNKPAGIRSLVYGIGKGKVRIEGLCVSNKPGLDGNGKGSLLVGDPFGLIEI